MSPTPQAVIINCSPRRDGNSEQVVARLAGRLSVLRLHSIRIHDLSIHPCGDCDRFCEKTGHCRLHDDMYKLYELFDTAQTLIVVTPVHFYNFPGYAKLMIDRCQPYWVLKKENRPPRATLSFSAAVMIGATKGKDLFLGMKQTFHALSSILGVERVEPHHVLEIRRVDARGEVENHLDEVDQFADMVNREVLKTEAMN